MSPNDPLWPIYLWFLIHGGDPAPDQFLKKVFTAVILGRVSNNVREPQAKAALRTEALRHFESSFEAEEFAKETFGEKAA